MRSRASLVILLGILALSVWPSVGVSADGPAAASTPVYRVYPLRNGTCKIALPAHDPQVLQRWPQGIIGAN